MVLPKVDDMYFDVLDILKDGKEYKRTVIADMIADKRDFSKEDREDRLSGGQIRYHNRIGWTCTHLKKATLIESKNPGYVSITDEGLKILTNCPQNLNNKYFEAHYPSYYKFQHPDEKVEDSKKTDDNDSENEIENSKNDENINSLSSFQKYLLDKGFIYNKETIENYLLSLKVKPFLILTGNSGTGKTKLSQLYSKFIDDEETYNVLVNKYKEIPLESDKTMTNEYKILEKYLKDNFNEIESYDYQLIPVGANWTDNRNILGYYNIIKKEYEYTPAYKLIKLANDNRNLPFFLILDEMNLSQVERYFADFLSAMESDVKIPLYGTEEKLEIPNNLYIIGTVNVDETTYMFSPKVLDRANVIEFETYPVDKYMGDNSEFNDGLEGDIEFLIKPNSKIEVNGIEKDIQKMNINDLKDILKNNVDNVNENLWLRLKEELKAFQDILRKVNFDFGFRVTNEILRFMVAAWYYEKDLEEFNWERYFDAQIKQKILPKIHGSEFVIGETLNDLLKQCLKDEIEELPEENEISKENTKFIESAKKLSRMRTELENKRYISFID